ncbi:helix-turn-helix transcriptional regulator [Carnobacterium maltaromaticum]|uniref:helix-turn-helix transcriptional regulator n=1 Tax=Carnobacterium maltaromaticum TaxID=2751 RepID=UPI001DE0A534|nr:helix-turn-helix transcriptional regulator [Carnobacterium maltaromaticum]MCC4312151.1 XRE family transcriptional regulator [Carnobacterium maltaromaticum]
MEKFSTDLKKYRIEKGLTQDELAQPVGIRRETIQRLESAKYNPSLLLSLKISKVLDVPIEKLFQIEE